MAKRTKKVKPLKPIKPEANPLATGEDVDAIMGLEEEVPEPKPKKLSDIKPDLMTAPDEDESEIDLAGSTGVEKDAEPEAGTGFNDDELRSEIDRNLQYAVKAKASWMDVAKEDIEFCLGEQWTEQEKNDLVNARRQPLVFNKIKPMVQLVTGHLIQNKARIQAFPEGGEDELFTEVMDRAIDHIDKVSHLNYKLSHLFGSAERAGESWLEFHIDYEEDPIFGQLQIPNLGPFKIFMDPSSTEYDLSDASFGFKVVKLSRGKLKQLYPDKAAQIDQYADDFYSSVIQNIQNVPSGDESDYGNDPIVPRGGQVSGSDEQLEGDLKDCTTVEYWKREYVERYFAYFVEDGSYEEFDTEEEAKAEVARRQRAEATRRQEEMSMILQKKAGAPVPPPMLAIDPSTVKIEHAIRKRRVKKMKVAVVVGSIFLTDGLVDSPFEPHYSGFPFFRHIAEYYPDADKPELRVQSMVRSLKDPQREVNKARSQYLHILNTSANSGWIGDDDALTEAQWEEVRQFGAVPGITIRKKRGTQLDRIHPVEPSMAQQVREKSATNDFKEVSGLNADMLAMDQSANPSGKAIALRIRQAITILQTSFENFRFTKMMIGDFLFSIIPVMFDAAKLEKVLGQKFMAENQLNRAMIQTYLTMIEDGKYNVQISEAGAPDTLRAETFEDIMELVKSGMPFPPDMVIEFMNIPNKTEMVNRLKEYQQQAAQAAAQQNAPGAPGR